jgi:exodeoxyribonuclease V alpha subunit
MVGGMGNAALENLRGEVERVTFFSEDSGFAVLRVRVAGRREPVTVTGRAAAVQAGEELVARGCWVEDRQFGRQFKAESLELASPQSPQGITRFLGSGLIEGVGPVLAGRIVEKFGAGVFAVLDEESKRLEEVDGIGAKKRKEIKASWDQQQAIREIMVFLHGHGISTSRAVRIHKTYGDQAREVLERNPFQLAEDIFGIGFKTADGLAAKLGMPPDAPQRRRAALLHVLRQAREEGHCALPQAELLARAEALLGCGVAAATDSLAELAAAGEVAPESIGGEDLVFLPGLRAQEIRIVERVAALRGTRPLLDETRAAAALAKAEAKGGIELAEGQRAAVRLALNEAAALITGGPGVGKTTVLRTVLAVLDACHLHTVLAAPTGRAAKRLNESCGREAGTLHRLLQFQPAGGFFRNRRHPLQGDVFVIDEVSMVDVPLMAAFLDAVPDGARLLLVGDADQLPSVGPGTVLADLLASGALPVARLTEIYRQAATSRIVAAAHAVNRGNKPELTPVRDSDCFFLPRPDAQATLETLVHLVRDRLPAGLGVDALADVQVLAPMNIGLLGTGELNRRLQEALNPPDEFKPEVERFGAIFRRGDKVIQLRNNYDKQVYNGDIGRVVAIDFDPVRLWLRFEDGRVVDYDPGELDEVRHAYAVTIHKSQGSEFPVVVIPLVMQHFALLQRNLLYTGLTRGRRQVVLVGEERALRAAIARAEATRRWGGLGHRFGAGCGATPAG